MSEAPQENNKRRTLLDSIAEDMGVREISSAPSSPKISLPASLPKPPAVIKEEKPLVALKKREPASLQDELSSLEKRLSSLLRQAGKKSANSDELRAKSASLRQDIERLERSCGEQRLSLQLLEEERRGLESKRDELRDSFNSLKQAAEKRAQEAASFKEDITSLTARRSKAAKRLELISTQASKLEASKESLERKIREAEMLAAEENEKLQALTLKESELTRALDQAWDEIKRADEEKQRIAESIKKKEKELALAKKKAKAKQRSIPRTAEESAPPAPEPSPAAVEPPAPAAQPAPEEKPPEEEKHALGITDAETLQFLSKVKYSERFSEEAAQELSAQGFTRVYTASSLTRALLKRVAGERRLEFFVQPRSAEPEKELACWLLAVLLSDEARDVVSSGGVFDVSFLKPASSEEPGARYALEVSLRAPSGDDLALRLKKLSWARDFLILASEEASEAWKKSVSDPLRVLTPEDLERESIPSILARLNGFAENASQTTLA